MTKFLSNTDQANARLLAALFPADKPTAEDFAEAITEAEDWDRLAFTFGEKWHTTPSLLVTGERINLTPGQITKGQRFLDRQAKRTAFVEALAIAEEALLAAPAKVNHRAATRQRQADAAQLAASRKASTLAAMAKLAPRS